MTIENPRRGADSIGKPRDFSLNWYWGHYHYKRIYDKESSSTSAEAGAFTLRVETFDGKDYDATVNAKDTKGGYLDYTRNHKTRVDAQHAAERMLEKILMGAAAKIGCRIQPKLPNDRK